MIYEGSNIIIMTQLTSVTDSMAKTGLLINYLDRMVFETLHYQARFVSEIHNHFYTKISMP